LVEKVRFTSSEYRLLCLGKARPNATSGIWEWGTLNQKHTNFMGEVLDTKWWACSNCAVSTLGDIITLGMEMALSSPV